MSIELHPSSLEADVMENLTSLEDLDLSINAFKEVPSEALLALTRLKRLNLRGNSVSDLTAPEALAGLKSVQELTLADNGVEKVSAIIFARDAINRHLGGVQGQV